ncbi:MAG: hypothetical protein KDK97_13885 [Verrucomicrobiales bacterium]|nr:hypothetical protein [Verrucomicrobiales bacterium]MCP5557144.1 hypothetical protein [Verrucomicrobiaceae bacterium]
MAPLLALGHGMEFLQARVRLEMPGKIRIELTADFEDNPLIKDEQDARLILTNAFFVNEGGEQRAWADVAPLTFEKRDQPDPTAPVPEDPTWKERPHGLLTALWEYAPKGPPIHLATLDRTPHDILMWTTGTAEGTPAPPWQILICGDVSKDIQIRPVHTNPWPWGIAGIGFLIALGAGKRLISRRSASD